MLPLHSELKLDPTSCVECEMTSKKPAVIAQAAAKKLKSGSTKPSIPTNDDWYLKAHDRFSIVKNKAKDQVIAYPNRAR